MKMRISCKGFFVFSVLSIFLLPFTGWFLGHIASIISYLWNGKNILSSKFMSYTTQNAMLGFFIGFLTSIFLILSAIIIKHVIDKRGSR